MTLKKDWRKQGRHTQRERVGEDYRKHKRYGGIKVEQEVMAVREVVNRNFGKWKEKGNPEPGI